MRDDVLGLASFRILGPNPGPEPSLPTLSTTQSALNKPSFAKMLEQARNVRMAKPYVSPMKRSAANVPSPNAQHRIPLPHPRPPSTTTSLSRPPTTVDRSAPPRPTTPLAPPDPLRTPTQTPNPSALPLDAYPHPNGDNGRGMHWVPTTKQSNDVVDRFVEEAKRMGVKWVTFLNNGATIGDNDYLVQKLVGAGIEPVMRLYSPTLEPIQGDIEGMVRHYVGMGVHYFQPYNEPNVDYENPDGKVSVDRYLDNWIPVAKAIVRGGGLPGFGSMAPGGDFDDQQFLRAALDGLKARGELGTLDRAWLSMHNYTWNHPIQDRGDGDGFFKFRAYHQMVNEVLGRDLPIIGTEGGSFVGEQEDPKMAAVTPDVAANWTAESMRYLRNQREPWLFASSIWTIADLAAGGSDPRFEAQALFHADGTQSPIVSALQNLGA